MKSEMEEKGRRSFLRNLISGAAVVLVSKLSSAKAAKGEKVKLLTPDGKLVEVDRTKINGHTAVGIASNKEVMNWMKSAPKNS